MNEIPAQNESKLPCHRDDALAVLLRLRQAGHVAYFAGGCVRDELLGIAPKDFDVATDAPPARVRQLFSQTQAVGAAFGVILVHQAQSTIEVATFRTDGTYLDGRRPSKVEFTTAEEDAKRRDFTINGLFLDPVENKVIDHVSGLADLSARVIRAIGDPSHRFEEDHLRLLRAVRFASRFGFELERGTADAIMAHAPQLARISPERIADELRRMLVPTTRIAAWEMLREFGLLPVILRFMPPVSETSYADRGFAWLFPNVAPDESISFGLALAAIAVSHQMHITNGAPALTQLGETDIRKYEQALRKALKISNDESDQMLGALRIANLLEEKMPTVATMKRFLAGAYSGDARRLLWALGKSDVELTDRVRSLESIFTEIEAAGPVAPAPLVTGDDLTAAGLRPGKLFKLVLDQVYDAQLESRVVSKQDALELALNVARSIK